MDGGIIWKMLSDGGTSPQYSGTHTDTLRINNVPFNHNTFKYRCLLTNACGDVLSMSSTLYTCGLPLTDARDSKVYPTIPIGNQCWMAENLNIGTMLNSSSGGQLQTNNGIIEKYCYGNNFANCDTYGGLYEWYETMQYNASDAGNPGTTQGICPAGWHLPTNAEWTDLTNYLGGESAAGGKMKETGLSHWTSPNTGATNESGFTGLPGGYRGYIDGTFNNLGGDGSCWSATEYSSTDAWRNYLMYSSATVFMFNYNKQSGYSVRCLMN